MQGRGSGMVTRRQWAKDEAANFLASAAILRYRAVRVSFLRHQARDPGALVGGLLA
jgi:hypothetical protein